MASQPNDNQYSPVPSTELLIQPDDKFEAAAEKWLQSRLVRRDPSSPTNRWCARYIMPKTEKSYRQYIGSLSLFFGGKQLADVRLDHLRTYQRVRSEGAAPFIRPRRPHEASSSCPVKAPQINKELIVLTSILKRALLWDRTFQDYFQQLLEEPSEIPRALTPHQERKWLEVSFSEQRWWLIHWYSVLALTTCMGTNEIRSLRIGDINMPARVLTVPIEGAKNRHRHRTIPLGSQEVLWAVDNLLRRAAALGCSDPQHYLFPFRICRGKLQDKYDPTRR